jgi:hypothetical protein
MQRLPHLFALLAIALSRDYIGFKTPNKKSFGIRGP